MTQLKTGWGRVTIEGLGAGQVWATLVPDLDPGVLSVNAAVDSSADFETTLAGATLDKGRVAFIEAAAVGRGGDSLLQRFDDTAAAPDGRFIFGLSAADSTLVVIDTSHMKIRQEIVEGLAIDDGGTPVSGLAGADNLVVSPDGQFVFAFDEGSATVAAFRLDATAGTLSFAGTQGFDVAGGVRALEIFRTPSTSPSYSFLRLDHSFLLLGGDGQSVETGSYDAATGTFQSGGPASKTDTVLAQVTVSNDGELYYAISDSGVSFEVRSTSDHARIAEFVGPEYGFLGAAGMAVSPDDRFVYLFGKLSHSISVFERGAGNAMTFVETLQEGVDGVRGLLRPSAVAVSTPQAGSEHRSFLFAAGEDGNSVGVFLRDEATGRLQFVQTVVQNADGVEGLRRPTGLMLSPGGDRLYVSTAGQPGIPGGLVTFLLDADPDELNARSMDVSFTNIASLTVTTAGGDDSLAMLGGQPNSANGLSRVTVDLGEGDDHISVTSLVGRTSIRMGGGDDSVLIAAGSPRVELEVHLDAGNDEVSLLGAGSGSRMFLHGDDGDDTFRVDIRALAPDMADLMIHGGEPFPTAETDRLFFQNWHAQPGQTGPDPVEDPDFNAIRLRHDPFVLGQVREGDPALQSAQGMLGVTDPDAGQSRFAAQTVAGVYGAFTIDALGAWRYTLDETDPDIRLLNDGQAAVETFVVNSIDGTGGAEVSIQVFGAGEQQEGTPVTPQLSSRFVLPAATPDANSPAVISGDLTGAVSADDPARRTAAGSLSASDADAGEDLFLAQAATPGRYGRFTLQSDGSWSYVLEGDAADSLQAGQTAADAFIVASADGTESVVVVTVTQEGPALNTENRAAAISGDLAGEAIEDDPVRHTAAGQLSVTDPDAGEQGFRSQTATPGRYGRFTLQSDGSWSYVLDDYAVDALAAGQKAADAFIVASTDGTESVVVVTVTGANDPARVFGGHAVRHASVDISFERPPVVSLNQPLSTYEGDGLVIEAQVVPYGARDELLGELEWDLNGDGVFGDRTGETITLTWQELVHYGFDDDGSDYPPIVVRATNMDAQGNPGQTSHAQFHVTIHNTPPEISVHGEETATLGAPYTISFDAYDPGDDTVVRWRIDWGDGQSAGGPGTSTIEEFGAGTRSAQHIYDEVGLKSILVTAIDEDGETLGPVHSVSVVVDAIQLDAGGPYTVREGEDLVLHTSAPGAPSYHAVYSPSFTISPITPVNVPLWSGPSTGDAITIPWDSLQFYRMGDDGEYTLRYRAQYSDEQTAEVDFDVVVTNAPPVADMVVSATSVDEGGEVEIVVSASDPALVDTLTYNFDIDNDGVYERVDQDGGSESRHTFTFPDNAEQIAIRVLVSDDDGGHTEVFGVLTVDEVAPILNVEPVSGAFGATEGGDFSVRLSATDPGDDTISHWVVDWGDGSPRTTHEGAAPTVVHRFRESGPTAIRFWAYDEDGAYHVSKSMTVANAAPTLANVIVTPGTEGAETRLSGRFSDPGAEESFEALVDWGDGSRETHRLDGQADDFDFNHVYARDGTYTIVITLRDADAAEDTATAKAVVVNAVPEISLNAERYVIQEGEAVTVFGTVADLGSHDTHTVVIDWGDGTAASSAAADTSTGYYTATHVYGDDASSAFTIAATVTDSDGATNQASVELQVENIAPAFQYFYLSSVDDVDYPPPRINVVWDDAEFTTVIATSAVNTVTVTGSYSDYDADVRTINVRWGDGNITSAVLDENAETFAATYSYDSDPSAFVDDIALLMSTPQARLDEGSRIAVTGRVRDVGADVVAVRIDWGDDAADDVEVDPATGEFTMEHTYSAEQGTAGFYLIAAVATDDDGGARSSTIAVPVDRAPVFSRERYTFDLSENRDGSQTPVGLGAVEATDVNPGDEITYSIEPLLELDLLAAPDVNPGDGNTYGISNDPSNFAIDPTTGMLRYVGTGEDFESAPFSYELTVRATDLTGRSHSARVTIAVTGANDAAVIGGELTGAATEDAALIGGAGQADRDRDPDADQDAAETAAQGRLRGGRPRWRGPTEPSRWTRTVRGSTGSTTRTRTPTRWRRGRRRPTASR